jgi:hypothetical protein
MSNEILDAALAFTCRHLLADGVFYANVNIGEEKELDWQGFPVVWRPLEFYEAKCADNGLVLEDIGALADYGHGSNVASQDSQRMLRVTKLQATPGRH